MPDENAEPRLVLASLTVYRLLLVFYPTPFQREYGPHMAQVFRDCCLKTYRQSGPPGMLSLWALTLIDWFKTVIEEQLNRGNAMTRSKYIRLSGWALIIAAVVLVAGFGIGGGETRYDDPLGGFDGFYEYSQLILIPASLLLYTIGMLGLQIRYGKSSGWLVKSGLTIAVLGAGLSALSAIPLYALSDNVWMGEWWYLMTFSLLGMLAGLSLFGIAALNTKPLPRWNGLPLLTAIWFPLVFLARTIIEISGGSTAEMDDSLALVALLFMFSGSIILGYLLQSDSGSPGSTAVTA